MSYARIVRVDMSRRPPMSGLGETCGPCMIASGGECEICPDDAGAAFPECAGCVNGVRPSAISSAEQSIVFSVVAGVISTLTVTWLTYRIFGK